MKSIFCCMCIIFCLFLAPRARAGEELAPGYDACAEKAESTVDQVECLGDAYTHWDKILNANYQKTKKACADTEHPKACADMLLKAQRNWIQYKENMSEVIRELEGGGSASRVAAMDFVVRETKRQAQALASE